MTDYEVCLNFWSKVSHREFCDVVSETHEGRRHITYMIWIFRAFESNGSNHKGNPINAMLGHHSYPQSWFKPWAVRIRKYELDKEAKGEVLL